MGVEFHGGALPIKARPRTEAQPQINDAGLQRIDGLIQFDAQRIVGVKHAGLAQESLGQVGIDAPVALLIGVS